MLLRAEAIQDCVGADPASERSLLPDTKEEADGDEVYRFVGHGRQVKLLNLVCVFLHFLRSFQ